MKKAGLTFVDFEYFGWDDPVKLTADMLLHPGTPVAAELRSRFQIDRRKAIRRRSGFRDEAEGVLPAFWLAMGVDPVKRISSRTVAQARSCWRERRLGGSQEPAAGRRARDADEFAGLKEIMNGGADRTVCNSAVRPSTNDPDICAGWRFARSTRVNAVTSDRPCR